MGSSKHKYWSGQIDSLVAEMSKLCVACKIDMLEPGVAERVLRDDQSVCGRTDPETFAMLRKHLMAFCHVEERAIKRLGADEVQSMLDKVRASMARLRGAH